MNLKDKPPPSLGHSELEGEVPLTRHKGGGVVKGGGGPRAGQQVDALLAVTVPRYCLPHHHLAREGEGEGEGEGDGVTVSPLTPAPRTGQLSRPAATPSREPRR